MTFADFSRLSVFLIALPSHLLFTSCKMIFKNCTVVKEAEIMWIHCTPISKDLFEGLVLPELCIIQGHRQINRPQLLHRGRFHIFPGFFVTVRFKSILQEVKTRGNLTGNQAPSGGAVNTAGVALFRGVLKHPRSTPMVTAVWPHTAGRQQLHLRGSHSGDSLNSRSGILHTLFSDWSNFSSW